MYIHYMNLRKQVSQNDTLLKYFFDLGDDGNATIPQIEKDFSNDKLITERLRYLHANAYIRSVAPFTLAIDKPGITF